MPRRALESTTNDLWVSHIIIIITQTTIHTYSPPHPHAGSRRHITKHTEFLTVFLNAHHVELGVVILLISSNEHGRDDGDSIDTMYPINDKKPRDANYTIGSQCHRRHCGYSIAETKMCVRIGRGQIPKINSSGF